ncbi:hypothetical protein N473_26175 [Pseudoalteromonas luteoviolacea CPMOR-1]|uniref:Uncharacterized protein n=1 Tax=Pseudoalteromonas luteoviolacea CPMOR-1 TaxID=1365248 RepID=A0A167I564_9GAMM|nr:hypothetical protein N473_26175 [Pseudoalteromonas luteoviolacea CPMOR-1]
MFNTLQFNFVSDALALCDNNKNITYQFMRDADGGGAVCELK